MEKQSCFQRDEKQVEQTCRVKLMREANHSPSLAISNQFLNVEDLTDGQHAAHFLMRQNDCDGG